MIILVDVGFDMQRYTVPFHLLSTEQMVIVSVNPAPREAARLCRK